MLALLAQTLLASTALAADPPPLDDDFLDYLSEFEGKSDDWTWFADDEQQATQARSAATAVSAARSKDQPAKPVASPVQAAKDGKQ